MEAVKLIGALSAYELAMSSLSPEERTLVDKVNEKIENLRLERRLPNTEETWELLYPIAVLPIPYAHEAYMKAINLVSFEVDRLESQSEILQ